MVRLKGGDPYIFGRGGEEVHYLSQRGIQVYVVPGARPALTSRALAPWQPPLGAHHRAAAGSHCSSGTLLGIQRLWVMGVILAGECQAVKNFLAGDTCWMPGTLAQLARSASACGRPFTLLVPGMTAPGICVQLGPDEELGTPAHPGQVVVLQRHLTFLHCSPCAGITAASGICAELGIPLTHRGLATSVRYLTGHAQEGGEAQLDSTMAACADPDTTLVVYMGLATLPALTQNLTAAGLPPGTPAVAVERGTTPQQRTVRGSACVTATVRLTACLAAWKHQEKGKPSPNCCVKTLPIETETEDSAGSAPLLAGDWESCFVEPCASQSGSQASAGTCCWTTCCTMP